jgi:hypothetical protein
MTDEADVPIIGVDDFAWPRDDVHEIAIAPFNKPLQPMLTSGLRPLARRAER